MNNLSRRSFLSRLAGFSSLATLPMLGFTNSTHGSAGPPANITFVIDFSGPLAFISKSDNYIYVCAPETKAPHDPVVSSDSGELLMPDDNGYEVTWPRPNGSPRFLGTQPITFTVKNAFSKAYDNCRIGLKVSCPSYVKGLNTVRVQVDKPPSAPFPTGLRFIYENMPTTTIPTVQSNGASFIPQFDASDPFWRIKMRMIPKDADPCHAEAIQSFKEIGGLCGVNPIPTISYHDPLPCTADRSHEKSMEESSKIFRGPGSDCQVLSVWINNT